MSKVTHYRFFAGMSLAIDAVLLLPFLLAAVLVVAFLLGVNPAAAGSNDGIKSLITVTQMKAQDAEAQAPNGQLDSLGDTAEVNQMQLQEQTSRRAKAVETTSNIMKKQSDAQHGIIQNIK